MIRYLSALTLLFFVSCKTGEREDLSQPPAAMSAPDSNSAPMDSVDYEYATYFIVIADTGLSYPRLHEKMLALNQQLSLPIDTLGRSFDAKKNLIALPDNDEDEIYAGDYFPRRFPSVNLSLEYLDFYRQQAGHQTMALVAGIYAAEQSADSALATLKPAEPAAFTLSANVFIGCMH